MTAKPSYEELERRVQGLETTNTLLEKKLHEARFFSEEIMTYMTEGLVLTDTRGTVIFINQRLLEMLGYLSEEIIGKCWLDLVPADQQSFAKEAEARRSQGLTDRYEIVLHRKNGEKFPVLIGAGPRFDKQGGQYIGSMGVVTDITERKRADEALREAKERTEAILHSIQSGVFVINAETHSIMDANPAALRMLGADRKDVIGRVCHQFVCPKQQGNCPITDQGESVDNREAVLLKADGEQMEILKTIVPITLEGRECLLETFWDITDQKQAEETLIRVAQEWQNTFDANNDAIWILDKNQRVARSNKAAESYFQLSKNQMIDKHCWEIVHDTDHPIPECPTLRARKSLHREDMELKIGEKWFLVTVDPILNAASQFNGAVHIIKDITEHKRVDEENEMSIKRFQALMQLNQMTEATLTETTDFALEEAVRLTRSKIGYLAFLNEDETVLTMHSWSKSAMQECSMTDKPISYPLLDTGLWGEAVRQRKTVITNDYPAPNPLKKGTPAGHVTLLRHMNTPIFDGDKIVIVAGVGNKEKAYTQTDADQISLLMQGMWHLIQRKQAVTEREKLQNQLMQAQKMESVGRLAGGVAHDFNNMLGVILGHTELALLQADEHHELHGDLKEIQKAAKRSADITKQLLAFARKQTISPKQIDLNDTVESMLNMLRRLIGEDIDLVWQPGAHLWPVKMDPTQIDQILANLCVNARDAISGVGKLTIETGRKSFDEEYCKQHAGFTPGDFVLLAVSDNGCGMVKDTLANLFEPFFTTKGVGKGTGLGLATVYGIVKQNNGFINVYSEPGQGSTFKIYLPRLVADEDTDTAAPEKKAAAGGTETILLVEDEQSILRMTRMMLERKGYTVLSSATPAEAMEKAKNLSGAIDLLMTDVVMPEMNGRDLAGKITALYPDIRLLFMSGYTANVIAHHGVLDAGVAFIQKPFSMTDLMIKVREVLDKEPDETQG